MMLTENEKKDNGNSETSPTKRLASVEKSEVEKRWKKLEAGWKKKVGQKLVET